MTHIETTQQLVSLLALEDVSVGDIQEGDVIWAQGRVVIARNITPYGVGTPIEGLSISEEPDPHCPEGYLRGIALKKDGRVLRIPKAWIRDEPGL
jgi:hypothetical protein